mmetsp:Transcript_10925/g.18259  ORF Transcript_10925/g.18259 Transcript_10925/m.18259 type:complete len:110 (+) Transcript_10925:743-1072(+)
MNQVRQSLHPELDNPEYTYFDKENYVVPLPHTKYQDILEQFEEPFEYPEQMRGNRRLIKMDQTDWYIEDNLGLRALNDADRLIFLHMRGDHDEFSMEEAEEMFVPVLNL